MPLVCLDETSKQLLREVRTPIPAAPGRPACENYEYERNAVAALFMMVAPLAGWRHVAVCPQRTRREYAHGLRDLAEGHWLARIDRCNLHHRAVEALLNARRES